MIPVATVKTSNATVCFPSHAQRLTSPPKYSLRVYAGLPICHGGTLNHSIGIHATHQLIRGTLRIAERRLHGSP